MTEYDKKKKNIYDKIIKTAANFLLFEDTDSGELFDRVITELEEDNNWHIYIYIYIYTDIRKSGVKLSIIDKDKYNPIIKKVSMGTTKSYDIKNAIVYDYDNYQSIKKDVLIELSRIRDSKIDNLLKD